MIVFCGGFSNSDVLGSAKGWAGAFLYNPKAKAALDAMLTTVGGALKDGQKVALIGFGTFQVVKKNARQGINPATKQKIKIAAKKVVKFKAGADLAKKVNSKKK